jgi:hypothetical protein
MREIIIRFLKFQPLNEHPMVYAGLGVVWITLIAVTMFSIRSQGVTPAARWGWLVTIIALPIAGLGAYLIWCLFRVDYPFLTFFAGRPAKVESKLVATRNGA